MHTLGTAISLFATLLMGVIILRGIASESFKLFPVFHSYLVLVFSRTLAMYLVFGLNAAVYPSAYWFSSLIIILAEFAVLIEISDHIFHPFPIIRRLGRFITILISTMLGVVYILPAIVGSSGMRSRLFGFALRATVTKAVILGVLLLVAHHYAIKLGRNVKGLMLGFSIYLGINIGNLAIGKAFAPALYGGLIWIMLPIAYTLCLLVWLVAMWQPALESVSGPFLRGTGAESDALALELDRFNSRLSHLLHR